MFSLLGSLFIRSVLFGVGLTAIDFEPPAHRDRGFCLFCLLKLRSCVPIGAQLARFAVHFVHKLTGFASIYIRAAVKNGRVMVSGAEDIADARSRPRNRAGRLGAQFSRSKVPSFEAHRLQKGISLVPTYARCGNALPGVAPYRFLL